MSHILDFFYSYGWVWWLMVLIVLMELNEGCILLLMLCFSKCLKEEKKRIYLLCNCRSIDRIVDRISCSPVNWSKYRREVSDGADKVATYLSINILYIVVIATEYLTTTYIKDSYRSTSLQVTLLGRRVGAAEFTY